MIIPGKLNRDWPWVKDGIEVIRKRCNAEWLAEDLYCQIKTGKSSLYVNEAMNAFGIIRPIENPYTGEPGLEILDAYAPIGEDTDALMDDIEELAKSKGYVFIQMDSIRKGFERKGWTMKKIVYTRRLS